MALVLQQQLLVACDTLCELGGSLVGSVEGNHNNAVHTSQSGTHGLGLGAQHVHIAVKQSLVVCGGDGADVHLGAFLAGGILAYNLRPKHAGCTDLGNLHEVNAVDTQVELDVLGGNFGGHTGLGELCHVFVTPSQGVAQILIAVGSCIGEVEGIHSYGTEVGVGGEDFHEFLGASQFFGGVLALGDHLADGVEADAALNLCGVVTLLLEIGNQNLGQFHRLALASLEVELYAFGLDAVKKSGDVLGAQFLGGNVEADAVHALVEDVKRLFVCCLGAFALDVLTDVPFVTRSLVAANIGELTGQGVNGGQFVHVFLAVERFHGESFVGSPNHLFLIVCSLEVYLNLLAPFLGAGGGKIRKKFFFIICHF